MVRRCEFHCLRLNLSGFNPIEHWPPSRDGILLALREVVPDPFMQAGLIAAPSPTPLGIKGNISIWVKINFFEEQMPLMIVAMLQSSMPHVERPATNERDASLDISVKTLFPG